MTIGLFEGRGTGDEGQVQVVVYLLILCSFFFTLCQKCRPPIIKHTHPARARCPVQTGAIKCDIGYFFSFRISLISPSNTSSLEGAGGAAGAASSFFFMLFIVRIAMNITKAMIRKSITACTNMP